MRFQGKRVLVTGGGGFIGKHLCAALMQEGAEVKALRSSECDLLCYEQIEVSLQSESFDLIFHLAADVGGIGYMQAHGAEVFENNLLMNTQLLRAARRNGVGKLVNIASINCYPAEAEAPYLESSLFDGQPALPVLGYAYAKRAMLVHSELARQQFGFNSINLILDSVYGPGESFSLDTARVLPANVARFVDAAHSGVEEVTCWGTGEPVRDFLHVDDAVSAIIQSASSIESSAPVNIGSGNPLSLRKLIVKIADQASYRGSINWDHNKPDGQAVRYMTVDRLKSYIDWRPRIDLDDGIKAMIHHYRHKVLSR